MTVLIGTIMAYAGDVDGNAKTRLESKGWLVCDGAEYRKKEYSELDRVIGTYYGQAENSTYFKLPDLRGRFLRGVDGIAGRDPDKNSRTATAYGGNTGNKVGSVQEDEYKEHNHSFKYGGYIGDDHYTTREKRPNPLVHNSSYTKNPRTVSSGGGGSETRPKNIYINWIIKAKSVA